MFGIRSKQLRQPDGANLKGYELSCFQDAFSRYVVVQSATKLQPKGHKGLSDFQNATSNEGAAFQKQPKALQDNGCSVVAFQNDTAANRENIENEGDRHTRRVEVF